ncbi:hypothetical protein LTSEJOH_1230 [Salmonella enterica subsp. enterica serovar Johannesburg str. S5-703]|nr:hypothetical protein LTSEJOH_1230 [Salmonella enterica subsp. enterica serovar Johannesburg str. S5-703]
MLNETPALAPDGQPYRLLTLRNSHYTFVVAIAAQQRRDGGNADGLGSHSSFRPYTAV